MSIISPTKNTSLIIDDFIQYATQHLTTVSGVVSTVSLYPTVPTPTPAPSVINWTGYTVPPAAPTPPLSQELYDKIDWSKTDLDKNDPEIQAIINPSPEKIDALANEYKTYQAATPTEFSDENTEEESLNAASQINQLKAEKLNQILIDQGIVKLPPAESIKSGYKNLDELLQKAGQWAKSLGKNARVKYENLRSGYIKGVHGLCPQGTQAVVTALTGVKGLGQISGNADWFSFKNPSTGGGVSSFAKPIGGKVYYDDKKKIVVPKNANGVADFSKSYIGNPSEWQIGDIIVMGYTNNKPYGHIQVWTGWNWVSDFTQKGIQKNHVDTDTIALWRLNQNGKAAVQSQKNV
jgi:hypothetical protein